MAKMSQIWNPLTAHKHHHKIPNPHRLNRKSKTNQMNIYQKITVQTFLIIHIQKPTQQKMSFHRHQTTAIPLRQFPQQIHLVTLIHPFKIKAAITLQTSPMNPHIRKLQRQIKSKLIPHPNTTKMTNTPYLETLHAKKIPRNPMAVSKSLTRSSIHQIPNTLHKLNPPTLHHTSHLKAAAPEHPIHPNLRKVAAASTHPLDLKDLHPTIHFHFPGKNITCKIWTVKENNLKDGLHLN